MLQQILPYFQLNSVFDSVCLPQFIRKSLQQDHSVSQMQRGVGHPPHQIRNESLAVSQVQTGGHQSSCAGHLPHRRDCQLFIANVTKNKLFQLLPLPYLQLVQLPVHLQVQQLRPQQLLLQILTAQPYHFLN